MCVSEKGAYDQVGIGKTIVKFFAFQGGNEIVIGSVDQVDGTLYFPQMAFRIKAGINIRNEVSLNP